jgi:hypothetical protein
LPLYKRIVFLDRPQGMDESPTLHTSPPQPTAINSLFLKPYGRRPHRYLISSTKRPHSKINSALWITTWAFRDLNREELGPSINFALGMNCLESNRAVVDDLYRKVQYQVWFRGFQRCLTSFAGICRAIQTVYRKNELAHICK